MPDNSQTTDHKAEARLLCARLIPHTTSVQNVDLVAQALRLAKKRGHDLGYNEGVLATMKVENAGR